MDANQWIYRVLPPSGSRRRMGLRSIITAPSKQRPAISLLK